MKNKPLNGAEIARELGITRQAVSYSIRKSMSKMYKYILLNNLANTPFDAILSLMTILDINNGNVDDIRGFINLFDKSIRKEIEKDAILIYGNKKT
jgi:transcriptional regulator with XRE-family HTH domain